jgi:hypothetical protein
MEVKDNMLFTQNLLTLNWTMEELNNSFCVLLPTLLLDFLFLCQYNKSLLDTVDGGSMTQGKNAQWWNRKEKKIKCIDTKASPNGIYLRCTDY